MLSSLCRLVLITSSALLTSNFTIDFVTPASTPQSLLFCFNDTLLSTQGVQITSLLSSGGISNTSIDIMAGYPPISSPFNNSAQVPAFFEPDPYLQQLNRLESPIGLSDVLGTDPYYSTSYSNLRYDDFQMDDFGTNIRGIPAFPNITSFAQNRPVLPPVNCFLLTGKWTPLTQYQMTFTIKLPASSSIPALWFASLQAAQVVGQSYGSPAYQSSDIAFNLLGHKYGSICPASTRPVAIPSSLPLAESLCLQYTTLYQSWVNRTLSDNIVSDLFLSAFTKQAAGLIDANDILAANKTLYSQYMLDNRYPSSPTRQAGGVKPNCNKCKDGTFTSVTNDMTLTDVYDYRFGAMNVFRTIGIALFSRGRTCPALWDPSNPFAWTYGAYSNVLCQPIVAV